MTRTKQMLRSPHALTLLGLNVVLVLLASLALVAVQATSSADEDGRTVPERPNVVVIMADDMRADDLRFMPQTRAEIQARGLNYRNSFSPYPLCCPARASFLTGQMAHNHKVLSNKSPYGFAGFDDEHTIGSALAAGGYQTAYVGKYLNEYGTLPSKVTGKPSLTYVPPGWTDWYASVERLDGSTVRGGTYNYLRSAFNINGEIADRYNGVYQTNLVGQFTRLLINKYAEQDDPFFIYLSALAPHFGGPREPDDIDKLTSDPAPWGARYPSDFRTPARPDWVKGTVLVTKGAGMPTDGDGPEPDVSDKPRTMYWPDLNDDEREALRQLTTQRAESLVVLDREVGRIIAQLKASGTYDNTVLIFTSDNGYFLGEHRLRSGKIRAHEPSLRVPLLISGPGIPAGERFTPTRTFDLTATITDLAGVAPPHQADGRSLVPSFNDDEGWDFPVLTEARIPHLINDTSPALRAQIGFTSDRSSIGIRTARWKYIRDAQLEHSELYDLDADPNELINLVEDPNYDEIEAELLKIWWQVKDCAGTECASPLPAELQVDVDDLRNRTLAQAARVAARVGQAF